MKKKSKVLSKLNNIKKIDIFKTFMIINDKYISIDFDNDYNLVFYELFNYKLDDIFFTDQELKDLYDMIALELDNIFKYYYNLQDKIEEMLYPNESFYYLLINISKIYYLVDLGRFFLDKWFNSNNNKVRRIISIKNDELYLIEDSINYYVFELDKLFKNKKIEVSLFDDINMDDYESFILYSLLSIPYKIEGDNIDEVKEIVNYVDYTYKFLLEKYEKYKEDN